MTTPPPPATPPGPTQGRGSVPALLLAALAGLVFGDYAQDVGTWIACAEGCEAPRVRSARHIAVGVSAMTAVLGLVEGHRRGKTGPHETFALIWAVLLGSALALLKVASEGGRLLLAELELPAFLFCAVIGGFALPHLLGGRDAARTLPLYRILALLGLCGLATGALAQELLSGADPFLRPSTTAPLSAIFAGGVAAIAARAPMRAAAMPLVGALVASAYAALLLDEGRIPALADRAALVVALTLPAPVAALLGRLPLRQPAPALLAALAAGAATAALAWQLGARLDGAGRSVAVLAHAAAQAGAAGLAVVLAGRAYSSSS